MLKDLICRQSLYSGNQQSKGNLKMNEKIKVSFHNLILVISMKGKNNPEGSTESFVGSHHI